MSNTISTKKWKRWYPDELNEFNNISNQLISSSMKSNFHDIVNQNNKSVEELKTKVFVNNDFSNSTLNSGNEDVVNFISNEKNILDSLKEKKEFLIHEDEKKIFHSTIKEFLNNFQESMNLLDKIIATRLEKLVCKVTKKIIECTPVIEQEILLTKINFFLNKDIFCLKKIRLHVHPDNQLLVEDEFKKIFNLYGWTVVPDNTIDINGCKFSSLLDGSEFDCNVSARLNALSRITFSEE